MVTHGDEDAAAGEARRLESSGTHHPGAELSEASDAAYCMPVAAEGALPVEQQDEGGPLSRMTQSIRQALISQQASQNSQHSQESLGIQHIEGGGADSLPPQGGWVSGVTAPIVAQGGGAEGTRRLEKGNDDASMAARMNNAHQAAMDSVAAPSASSHGGGQ